MDADSIAHALRELNELESFTYVPPFRGRAIRMIRRDVPFEELEIDFAALEARKAAEYEKLNRVVRFALSGACRQQEILRYFGEDERRRRAATATIAAAARRSREAPSPAARSDRLVPAGADDGGGRGGADRPQRRGPHRGPLPLRQEPHRPDALRLRLGQDGQAAAEQLSTFGLLAHLKQTEVVTLIDGLIAVGCLEQVDLDRFRPVVQLTALGGEVMRRQGRLPTPGCRCRPSCCGSCAAAAGQHGEGGSAEGGAGGRQQRRQAAALRPEPVHRLASHCRHRSQANPAPRQRRHSGVPAAEPPAAALLDLAAAVDRLLGRRVRGDPRPVAGGGAGSCLAGGRGGLAGPARWCLPPELLAAMAAVVGQDAAAADPPAVGQVAAGHELSAGRDLPEMPRGPSEGRHRRRIAA